jgi:hypothetical protein
LSQGRNNIPHESINDDAERNNRDGTKNPKGPWRDDTSNDQSDERNQHKNKPWSRLEQALKATDLLLQAGGFAAIVLDMSDVLPQHTMRIPLATWYRFRLAAEQARTALIFLSQSPCASSCAALALRCEPASIQPFSANGETALFESQQYTLVRERNRNEISPFIHKKPSTRAEWRAEALWSRVR